MATLYAHTLAGQPQTAWEPLDKHLDEVAKHTAGQAAAFHAADWGFLLGYCHDLGKRSAEFQQYLVSRNPREAENAGVELQPGKGRVDHSTFGARHIADYAGGIAGELLAYCIAGHHAGLPNGRVRDDATEASTLEGRLAPSRPIPSVAAPVMHLKRPALPFKPDSNDWPFALAFFTRMLFSCLVDADRTCTEAFCEPEQAKERKRELPSFPAMEMQLRDALREKQNSVRPSPVNQARQHVLEQCLNAATQQPSFFSLQVPTGGGKTLSSLAFALRHVALHNLRRVVVAIPFTSIIEQTADVYREAIESLAENGLVEHHTNLRPEQASRANQMGSENWDAPLVVTTNVQLFESLFASAATPCRKLHRLAGSVIILDEAQALPVELLAPTLAALKELVAHYGCTVVLCTATQPALEKRENFPEGIEGVRPIIAEPQSLYAALRRVQVVHAGKLSTQALVSRLATHERVLAIMNTRAHAAQVFTALKEATGEEGCFHLSTLMCGAHRREVLARIREAAITGPCRVVSTQLIEAGVDLDLPVVYRAEAGFDSIAQAAGRCNREGKLEGLGTTYVFEADQPPPPGHLRATAQTARELFSQHADPLAPTAIEAYFHQHYWKSADLLDGHQIHSLMTVELSSAQQKTDFQFREIAQRFRMIEQSELPILVPYGSKAEKLLCDLRDGHLPYVSHRQLQPYLVSVPERNLRALEAEGTIRKHDSGVWLLMRDEAYDLVRGLRLESVGLDPRAWGL